MVLFREHYYGALEIALLWCSCERIVRVLLWENCYGALVRAL